jgi:hypothetical protein
MSHQNQATCYIKQIFTENYLYYTFSTSIKVETFIEEVKKLFVDIMNVHPEKIEVVEAGQEMPYSKPEDAPKIEIEDITMQEKYGDNIKKKAFYVRYTHL